MDNGELILETQSSKINMVHLITTLKLLLYDVGKTFENVCPY
jgi:hypothetical protein